MLAKFNNVKINSISAAVPKNSVNNNQIKTISESQINNVIKTIGIKNRRVSNRIKTSQLCIAAVNELFNSSNKDKIDCIICITQTPDIKLPGISTIIQKQLNLRNDVMCLDLTLACSGYVYGLYIAYSICSQQNINNVLLVVGDTLTKYIDKNDRTTSMLFGDAASATLVQKGNSKSYFSLNSDGKYRDILKLQNDNSNFFMDGMQVFNFTMRQVPKDINYILEYYEKDINDINYIIFHQANRYITQFFTKKMKLNKQKVLYSIEDFGNTSSTSIPLTIVTNLQSGDHGNILICGYGSGLSWGTSILQFNNIKIKKLVQV